MNYTVPTNCDKLKQATAEEASVRLGGGGGGGGTHLVRCLRLVARFEPHPPSDSELVCDVAATGFHGAGHPSGTCCCCLLHLSWAGRSVVLRSPFAGRTARACLGSHRRPCTASDQNPSLCKQGFEVHPTAVI